MELHVVCVENRRPVGRNCCESTRWGDTRHERTRPSLCRAEARVITLIFLGWLTWVVRVARRERSEAGILGDLGRTRIVVDVFVGIALLVVAGRLIVIAAKDIGESLVGVNSLLDLSLLRLVLLLQNS